MHQEIVDPRGRPLRKTPRVHLPERDTRDRALCQPAGLGYAHRGGGAAPMPAMTAWFRQTAAPSGGGVLTLWTDLVAGRNATPITGTTTVVPTTAAINNRLSITSSAGRAYTPGSSGVLIFPNADFTILVVARWTGTLSDFANPNSNRSAISNTGGNLVFCLKPTGAAAMISSTGGSGGGAATTHVTPVVAHAVDTWGVFAIRRDIAGTLYVKKHGGASASQAGTPVVSWATHAFAPLGGPTGSSDFNGGVAEVRTYASAISDADIDTELASIATYFAL
jgi:hypothetical protein